MRSACAFSKTSRNSSHVKVGCIFYWFSNVAVRRLLLFSHFVEQSRHSVIKIPGRKTCLDSASDFIWSVFSQQIQKPQAKGKSCWLWCGYLSLTKSQQRVGTVPHVMIDFFMHLFHALQSGKQGPDHTHSCRYEHKSWFISVEWKYLIFWCCVSGWKALRHISILYFF